MHMHASGRREAVRLWGPATSKDLDRGSGFFKVLGSKVTEFGDDSSLRV